MVTADDRDYTPIRTQYITGDKSLRQLADAHGIGYDALCRKAKAERWTALRKAYRDDVGAKAIKAAGGRAVRKLASIQQVADKILEQIGRIVQDEDQFYRHVMQHSVGTESVPEEHIFKKADSFAIKNLVSAVKDLTAVIRDVYGLQTAAQEVQLEAARQKIELERRKADVEAGDSTIKVVFAQQDGFNPEDYAQ